MFSFPKFCRIYLGVGGIRQEIVCGHGSLGGANVADELMLQMLRVPRYVPLASSIQHKRMTSSSLSLYLFVYAHEGLFCPYMGQEYRGLAPTTTTPMTGGSWCINTPGPSPFSAMTEVFVL